MRWTGSALAALAAALLAGCGDARPVALAAAPGGCSNCHGSSLNPAPPRALTGATATAEVTVGAHQLHLRDTPVRSAIPCGECHVVPAAVDSPGHLGPPPAEVTFGPLATHGGTVAPSWSRSPDARCSGVYCHGATMQAPPAQGPTWTFAVEPDPGRSGVCSTCHGYPPPAPHMQLTTCSGCHPATVLADGTDHTIDVAGGKHIDGALQVTVGTACASCHPFPPPSGAHAVHFGLTGVAGGGSYGDLTILQDRYPSATPTTAPAAYAFGCGHCHPLDPAKHMDGVVEVELQDAAAPAGSLKARAAPTAAYSGGVCSGTYCHSSGQATPSWVKPYGGPAIVSPAWTSGQALGCDGCHDNPPRYPTGGEGAPDANGHLDLADDGWEWGHFLGMPGPYHGTKHSQVPSCRQTDAAGNCVVPGPTMYAAPITCQTCHAQTVDPATAGASGFYWLDTAGDYHLPGGDAARLGTIWYQRLQCASCHDGAAGNPVPGAGRVLPLRHVNGARDVAFDPRTGFPSPLTWPIDPAFVPTRPYFVTEAAISDPISAAAGAVFEPQPLPATPYYSAPDLSVRLDAAGYDPTTKTCSSIGCHVSGAAAAPWGRRYSWSSFPNSCCNCHSTKCF